MDPCSLEKLIEVRHKIFLHFQENAIQQPAADPVLNVLIALQFCEKQCFRDFALPEKCET